MNNLAKRIITAIIGATLLVSAIFASPMGLWLVCCLISLLSVHEFLQLLDLKKWPFKILAMLLGILIWSIPAFSVLLESLMEISNDTFLWPFILILPLGAIATLFYSPSDKTLSNLSGFVLSFVYCLLPFYLLYRFVVPPISSQYEAWIPMGIFLLTWAVDTGAYFSGKWLGKRPLFARISPKKTWEGAIGGGILCLLIGLLLHLYAPVASYLPLNWIVVSIIIMIFSQIGDLVESMLKRNLNIKDSGGILPGHGGMLDRFDGLLISLPILFVYFSFI